jgi:hypothetical protein
VFGSASKIVGSLGSGVARLAFDDEYTQLRNLQRQKRADNVLEGVGQGLLALGGGVVSGVSGIVTQPIKGAQQGGAEGFFVGLGRGLMGVVVKPAVGVLDLASRTTEGIKNTPEMLADERVEPRRAPRFFAPDRVLRPYSSDRAAERERLRTMRRGAYSSLVLEVAARVSGNNTFVVSHTHALLLDDKDKQRWLASFASLIEVLVHPGSLLILKVNFRVAEREAREAESRMAQDITHSLLPRATMRPSQEQLGADSVKVPCLNEEQAQRLCRALRSAWHRWAAIEDSC